MARVCDCLFISSHFPYLRITMKNPVKKQNHSRRVLLFLIFLLPSIASFAGPAKQGRMPDDFITLMERAGMRFDAPDGMESTPILPNRDQYYNYAMKFPGKKFEVRYAVFPLDSLTRDYERSKKDTSFKVVEPNSIHKTLLMTIIANTSGGGFYESNEMPAEAVAKEFNADWGAVAVYPTGGSEFGKGYKWCMVMALHKKDLGEAYYFYLCDDKDQMQELMMPSFHSLQFNAPLPLLWIKEDYLNEMIKTKSIKATATKIGDNDTDLIHFEDDTSGYFVIGFWDARHFSITKISEKETLLKTRGGYYKYGEHKLRFEKENCYLGKTKFVPIHCNEFYVSGHVFLKGRYEMNHQIVTLYEDGQITGFPDDIESYSVNGLFL